MKSFSLLLYSLTVLLVLSSCDRLAEDELDPLLLSPERNSSVSILAGGTSVIHAVEMYAGILSFYSSSNQAASLQILQHPQRGVLEIDPNGYFLYTPNASFTSGLDVVTFGIFQNQQQKETLSLTIYLYNQESDLPCNIGAVGDVLEIRPNSVENRLDVLINDLSCTDAAVQLSIATAPAQGYLTQNGNQFTYTPNTGYRGEDYFIYRLCQASNTSSSSCSYAYVKLKIYD